MRLTPMNQKNPDLEKVSLYVTNLFVAHSETTPFLLYHNIIHTSAVVSRTCEIGSFYKLSKHALTVDLSAAWFHDCGHFNGPTPGHEQRSVSMMRKFTDGEGV